MHEHDEADLKLEMLVTQDYVTLACFKLWKATQWLALMESRSGVRISANICMLVFTATIFLSSRQIACFVEQFSINYIVFSFPRVAFLAAHNSMKRSDVTR